MHPLRKILKVWTRSNAIDKLHVGSEMVVTEKMFRYRSGCRTISLFKFVCITVEPRWYGYQGDMPKCPYYRGVRIKRVPR